MHRNKVAYQSNILLVHMVVSSEHPEDLRPHSDTKPMLHLLFSSAIKCNSFGIKGKLMGRSSLNFKHKTMTEQYEDENGSTAKLCNTEELHTKNWTHLFVSIF